MARLFTGIFPPERCRIGLQNLRDNTDDIDVRWTPADNLHITLAFIGHMSDEDTEAVSETLRRVRFDAFELRLSGVGAFPNPRKARVLWVGITPSEPVTRLHHRVAGALEHIVDTRHTDARPYHPHVTVARSRGQRRVDARSWVDRHAETLGQPFDVRSFALVRSRTKPEGAEYTIIERFGPDAGEARTAQDRDA